MTKKHFKKLASILKEMAENNIDLKELVSKIADFCEEENPRFSKEKFLKECEPKTVSF
jgi:hypothetical protein